MKKTAKPKTAAAKELAAMRRWMEQRAGGKLTDQQFEAALAHQREMVAGAGTRD